MFDWNTKPARCEYFDNCFHINCSMYISYGIAYFVVRPVVYFIRSLLRAVAESCTLVTLTFQAVA